MTQRFDATLDDYLLWHQLMGHTKATVTVFRKKVRDFLGYLEREGCPLEQVGRHELVGWLASLQDRPISPHWRKSLYQGVHAFLAWAIDFGHLPGVEDVAVLFKRLPPPKTPRVRKVGLTREQFAAVLDVCPPTTFVGARRRAMIWLFATTGMRRAEMQQLLLEDLDLRAGTVRIRMGKGQKERRVPVTKDTHLALLRYLGHLRRRDVDPAALWVTQTGQQMRWHGVGQDMRRVIVWAGLEGQVKDACHVWRRTFAQESVRSRIERPYATYVGGWTTPAMLDYYTAGMSEERAAVEAYRDFKPFG